MMIAILLLVTSLGNPVPSVTWFRKAGNSLEAIPLSRVLFKDTFTERLAVLTFDLLSEADDGNIYTCKGRKIHLSLHRI